VFRFENFEIWQRAADLDLPLFELADRLDRLKLFRFAEQLRAAALSITNNAQRTTNQAQRTKHNGHVQSTADDKPWRFIALQEFGTRDEARWCERELKKSRGRRLKWIERYRV